MSSCIKPFFTLNEGMPIAKIYNSQYDDRYLGIDYNDPEDELDIDSELELVSDILSYDDRNRRQISDRDQSILEECIENRTPPKQKHLTHIYDQCLDRLESSTKSTMRVQTGTVQPLPTDLIDQTDRIYIAGPSGSGKTIFIALWCLEYANLFPSNRIIVFSRKKYDKNLDMIPNLIRINLDDTFKEWLYRPEELEETEPTEESLELKDNLSEIDEPRLLKLTNDIRPEPIQDPKIIELPPDEPKPIESTIKIEEIKERPIEYKPRKMRKSEILKRNIEQEQRKGMVRKDFLDELENSVCIFDDIDVIDNEFIREEVRKLRDDLLETGRDREISVISTSHQINNYNMTRKLINEATGVVLFPYSGAADQVKNFLKNRMSLENQTIKSIMSLPTRWLYIFKNSPRYIIHEHGAILI